MLEYDVENLKIEVYLLKKQKKELKKEKKELNKEKTELEKKVKKDEKQIAKQQNEIDRLKALIPKPKTPIKKRIKRKAKSLLKSFSHDTDAKVVDETKIAAEVIEEKTINTTKTVTVVIPTYKNNGLVFDAVDSVLTQSYDEKAIKIILSFNGNDIEYKRELKEKYQDEDRIQIIESPKAGAGAARNYAISFLETDYVLFLDDDDILSKNYISDAMNYASGKVSIIITRMNNLINGSIETDTYINRAIDTVRKKTVSDYSNKVGLFSTLCGKFYKAEEWKTVYSTIPEDIDNTEDVLFWVDNIGKVKGKIVVIKESEEAYIRRITDNSLSRPSSESLYKFYVNDRLNIIDKCKDYILSDKVDQKAKKLIINIINAQTKHILDYSKTIEGEEKKKLLNEIIKSDNVFLNKSLFGDVQGIAFCHNFSPFIDASAFVATKRLHQISNYTETNIDWTVLSSDMMLWRKGDPVFDTFFAKQQYTRKVIVGKSRSNVYSQYLWGCAACEKAESLEYDKEVALIYSRSMWLGSHIAALKYKESHPDVMWIAEFSDPLYMTSNNEIRDAEKYDGEWAFLNQIYQNTELEVMEKADRLIFTNENQLLYMMEMNPPKSISDVREKSLVWNHPQMARDFTLIAPSQYELDNNKVNIAYFGTFYKARNIGQILGLLDDDRIILHIFTNQNEETEELAEQYSNLVFHDMIPQFEMLNLASRMDYCCMSDLDFNGPINPYLPSKLADYLSSGCKIIALCRGNSVLSKINHRNVLKTEIVDKEFLNKVVSKAKETNTDNNTEYNDSLITIAMAADEKYAIPMLVTIYSLVKNANDNTRYKIVILSDHLSEDTINKTNEILKLKDMPACEVVEMGGQYEDINIKIQHTSSPTFFRLQLPTIVNSNRCIYLDTDLVVLGDLTDLFHSCPDSYYIAGVKAAAYYMNINAMKMKAESLMIKELDKYVNAGVLVMNLEKMRKDNIVDEFGRLLKNNFASQDQDVINSACYDKIAIIPPKYNYMTKYAGKQYGEDNAVMLCYCKEDWKEACNNPLIIHYADSLKPWNSKDVKCSDKWIDYYNDLVKHFPNIKSDYCDSGN